MRRLRVECAWKSEQTHESLRRYLVEESWETLEAIDSGDPHAAEEGMRAHLLAVRTRSLADAESGSDG